MVMSNLPRLRSHSLCLADQAGPFGARRHGVGRGGVRTGYIGVIAGAREGALRRTGSGLGGDERGVQARGGVGVRGGITICVHMHPAC